MNLDGIEKKCMELKDEFGSEKAVAWIEDYISKNPLDLDAAYHYCFLLFNFHMDKALDKQELKVIELCAEIIKKFKKHDSLLVAKAYIYTAMLKRFAIDSLKYAELAENVLQRIMVEPKELERLTKIIEDIRINPNRRFYFFLGDDGYIVT